VRADESLAGTKILHAHAKGRDTDVAQGLGLGADGYMTKPFSTKELAARVRRCWSVRREARQARSRRGLAPGVVLALWARAAGRWPSPARWTPPSAARWGDAGAARRWS
jgi:DNA-binding response OmpR family regulator